MEKVVKVGYDTLEKIRNATAHDLARVELFGDITANQFRKEFQALYFDMLQALKTNKIKIRSIKMEATNWRDLPSALRENSKP